MGKKYDQRDYWDDRTDKERQDWWDDRDTERDDYAILWGRKIPKDKKDGDDDAE